MVFREAAPPLGLPDDVGVLVTMDNDQIINQVFKGIADFIGADKAKARERFERFAAEVSNGSKFTSLLRDVETEALLSGNGSAVSRDAARTLGASGGPGQLARDELFFAVTAELSDRSVNLTGVAAPAASHDDAHQHAA